MKKILQLRGQAKEDFYQSKYDYYKKFTMGTLVASCFVYFFLFVTDWQMYHYFSWLSVFLRSLVLIPLATVYYAYRKTNTYKIMATISFVMLHAIIWGNIWVTSYMTDQTHASEGFLVMSFFLLLLSFSAPPRYAIIAQFGLVFDILLAQGAVHYENIGVVLSFNLVVIFLLCIVDFIITIFYYDHYVTTKKLRIALYRDPLTQVYNRNKLEEIMGVGHDLSFMSENIFILIMDIDHFKKVNDTYGHAEGDRVLQSVADTLKGSLRGQDLIIRWGGEEFVAILFDSSQKQACEIAERMRETVENSNPGVCKVTISIGVAQYNEGDCFETIKVADQALYQAKQNDRNQVVCYDELIDLQEKPTDA